MSTIAYRAGVMAADSRAYSGGTMPIGQKCKVFRVRDNLVGISSSQVGLPGAMVAWLAEGNSLAGFEWSGELAFSMLCVDPAGRIFFANDTLALTGPLAAPYFAIGTGAHYALGAMHAGASATDAIRAAIAHDVWSGAPVHFLRHHKAA